jgi:hypothetical protein
MKFIIGDATDRALCVALKHEFLRCDDAFEGFAAAAGRMIRFGEDRRTAYRAYAWFLHHLYGCTPESSFDCCPSNVASAAEERSARWPFVFDSAAGSAGDAARARCR